MQDKEYGVVVLSSYPIVVEGIRQMLSTMPHFHFLASTSEGSKIPVLMSRHGCSLLLSDPGYAKSDPQQMLDFRRRWTVVALISHYVEQIYLKDFDGFVTLHCTVKRIAEILMEAVRSSVQRLKQSRTCPSYVLSAREVDVLTCIARGWSSKQIADNLCISINTVITHRRAIVRKTSIRTVAGLTAYALINGLITENAISDR